MDVENKLMHMKLELVKIYQEIFSGKLTREEALEKIRRVKQQAEAKATGVLLAHPVWESAAIGTPLLADYTQRHVVLCELPTVDVQHMKELLPHCEVMFLSANRQQNIAERYNAYALACFELIRNILSHKPEGKILIQVVMANQQEQLIFAGISGVLKTAALENPQLIGQVIITDPQMEAAALVSQLEENKSRQTNTLIKYEQGARYVMRWQEITAAQHLPKISFKDHGVYLLTGGLGGLGIVFTKEILQQTNGARIVLTGRSALTSARQAILDAFSVGSNCVEYQQLDLCDREQVSQLMASIHKTDKPLNGIIHCAGMIADNFIIKKSNDEFTRVLAPKVTGTFNLDDASKDIDLDFLVLFSSVVSLMGNVGQADYAAANGFIDQFAMYRNQLVGAGQRQGHSLAINWPLWQDGGMQIGQENQEVLRKTFGMLPMTATTGMYAFYRSQELGYHQTLVMEGNVAAMRQALLENQDASAPAPSQVKPPVIATIHPENLAAKTEDYLCKQFAGVLKLAAHKIDPQAPLEKYGIDSILAMSLTAELEKTFDTLPKTLFFEYQTIQELAGYFVKFHALRLSKRFGAEENNREKAPAEQLAPIAAKRLSRRQSIVTSKNTIHTDPIAIVGLSGRYPEAANIAAYWRNLREGKDCITEVPKERWDWREYYSEDRTKEGQHYSKWGGFITGVDEFDPRFFNISPREAASIDPQERLFLQHAWMAVEDAGYTRSSLQIPHEDGLAGQVGVYAGVMYGEYNLSGSLASIANRVSYFLNLHGPSMTLDTMCSSSLTAIHIACQDLKLGRTDLAIAGGVNVSIHPNKYLMLSTGQFISGDGHCQSFGEGGDGYIPGEGVGAVVLKRLSEAERDGNHIYGIIKGSSLNHGGKTNGYSVPNPNAQASAIKRALKESNTDPRHISYIEAHGTGTKLGDPIEIAALSKAFYGQDTGYCLIGSAKSNIGHCESAAGIAGLTKILLQLQHQQIVPSLHSKRLNPHIDFEKTPFIVNQTLRDWKLPVINGKALPRIAGISAFGAGGSNAHLIIQEYAATNRPVAGNGSVIIPLSARTEGQLKQKADDLLTFIRSSAQENKPIDLAAMAYTLQVGKEAMDERLGFVVRSIDQLAEKLQAYLKEEKNIEDIYQGQVKRDEDVFVSDTVLEKWIADKASSPLLEAWVKGRELDWRKLYGAVTPAFISLPTYPFAREHYWSAITAQAPNGTTTAVLHPLLHRNISNLNEQGYSSTFSGDEFFVSHANNKALPAVIYLEMARAAIAQALPVSTAPQILELHHIVWADPVTVSEARQVNIALLAKSNEVVDFEIYSADHVHCQGQVIVSRQVTPAVLDIAHLRKQMNSEQLSSAGVYAEFSRKGLSYGPSYQGITAIYRGNRQLLAHLILPGVAAPGEEEYVLHPGMVDSALQAGIILPGDIDGPLVFNGIDSARIISSCTREMFAWVRYSVDGDDQVDIDLCDAQGNICVQMRGIHYQERALNITAPLSEAKNSFESLAAPTQTMAVPKQIPLRITTTFSEAAVQMFKPSTLGKPTNVSLVTPKALKVEGVTTKKGTVCLSDTLVGAPGEVAYVSLYDNGNGIYELKIAAAGNTLSSAVIAQLQQALVFVKQTASIKVLLLSGSNTVFLQGGRTAYNIAVAHTIYETIASFPCPVIAVMRGNATGAGFLLGALCDFMICSAESKYSYTDDEGGLFPSINEELLFSERFGEAVAQDFLYPSTVLSGKDLKEKGWSCPILPADEVEAYAQKLALDLSGKPEEALHLLKQHLGRHLLRLVQKLTTVEAFSIETETATNLTSITSGSRYLKLETATEPVLTISIHTDKQAYTLKDIVSSLSDVITQVKEGAYYKAIVLSSEDATFISVSEEADAVLALQRVILASPVPVVAAITSNATGIDWLISQFCDACIYSEDGVYSLTGILDTPALAQPAAMIFSYRLGNYACKDILLTGKTYTGTELQRLTGAITVVKKGQVLSKAKELARQWTKLPLGAIQSWKKERTAIIAEKISRLPAWLETEEKSSGSLQMAPAVIALKSKVITATVHPEGIVEVKMADREAKNMFSPAFIAGMLEVFEHIAETAAYKVVVLTGYDSYFASGGTKESLLAIQEGTAKFTDTKIFQLAMACNIPVIAAMQGHGIGAGWAMGMFADFLLFSEESHYVSPYMRYGFTPGAAATLIFPDKTGYDLSRETLLTANEYAGVDLKKKGLPLPVLPRKEVVAAAFTLARQIAQHSRSSLVAAKHQLTRHLQEQLEETYRLELYMHDKTFVGHAATLKQINSNFYNADGHTPAASIPVASTPVLAIPTEKPAVAEHQNISYSTDALPGIIASLRHLLSKELHLHEDEIDEKSQFVDLGLDSITGVTFIRKINDKYKTTLQATIIYSYSTLAALSQHVKEEAEKQGTFSLPVAPIVADVKVAVPKQVMATPAVVSKLTSWRNTSSLRATPSAKPAYPSQPIAVVGMAGQFPGAKNIDTFWQNIAAGKNCISEIPKERWNMDSYYQQGEAVPGKSYSKWMGALEEYDLFDPLFFNISPTEAESMDPQQRLFLQTCWHSIENAGYNPQKLSGSKCGVYVGCAYGDYHMLSREQQLSAQGFTGGSTSILAARISYFLNLRGPSISIDTACSSSLVAIANACDSLMSGSIDSALAGGVYVAAGPDMHIKTAQSGMLSPDGKCYTFDQRANGFVPGEGVGMVMLKRLEDAERDHDNILGIIQGWGVNQDGKTNGITAPNTESQALLEQQVYDHFNIDPTSIQLIETHGTGTKLGDPIEVEGLRSAFKKYTREKGYCALSAVKSNIGHCLTAAGVAGFIKVLQAMKHKQLPPTINYEQLNEHINLEDSPFYVNTQLKDWNIKDQERRQAAISSFGFSGTNAHLVLGEYIPPVAVRKPVQVITENAAFMIPLSAKSVGQLKQKAADLLAHLQKEGASINLVNMAYTLQVGREAMEERFGCMVSSVDQLAEKLELYISGADDIAGIYQGQVKRNKEGLRLISNDDEMKDAIIDNWISQKKLSKLLDLWTKGLDLDWHKCYGDHKPQRVSLPVYPFAKERYWIDDVSKVSTPANGITTAVLHPLLHINMSDFSKQCYSATFSGEEFFLKDHQVFNQKILPGVAYLEMIRVAIEKSMPASMEGTMLELFNIAWIQPFIVNRQQQINAILLLDDSDPAANEQIHYEINSEEEGTAVSHFQGQATFSHQPVPAKLDITQLRGQMTAGKLSPDNIYTAFTQMGLYYGPAHQGVTAIYRGAGQVLADLMLPAVVAAEQNNYLLHPSLMDSALQASIGLFQDLKHIPSQPLLPFALGTLRIISGCTKNMVAWVRYSPDNEPGSRVTKLDIDLCDAEGNVCVQIKGFAFRIMGNSAKQLHTAANGSVKIDTENASAFNDVYYQQLIQSVLNKELSDEQAMELV
jgi:acyl transferase domain-containing protein/enoyl-CoA hydratase/carnithine racemase/acyl carrier protein